MPILQFVEREGVLDLSWGHPRPDLLPVRRWQDATRAALDVHDWQALTYGYPAGPQPLVDWLAEHIGAVDAITASPGEFFVTAGASHALTLCATVLAEPGDVALVDVPTYHFALRILRDRGLRLVPVPRDELGVDVDAVGGLVDRLRRGGQRIALLYLVPTFGNPTGRSLPEPRRTELVRFGRAAGVTIVEDDTYRELGYEGAPPASLWSVDPGGPVVRIGSFSKTVAPGLRLGFVQAGAQVVDRLAEIGYIDSGGGLNHSVALAMAEFARSGAYAEHVAQIRAAYRSQRDALVDGLRAGVPDLDVPSPSGGWFLWLPLPQGMTADSLMPVAERNGVSFAEGTHFYPEPGFGHGHVRLSFSLLSPIELADAADRLGAAIRSVAG